MQDLHFLAAGALLAILGGVLCMSGIRSCALGCNRKHTQPGAEGLAQFREGTVLLPRFRSADVS
jgi:hypothetical protein